MLFGFILSARQGDSGCGRERGVPSPRRYCAGSRYILLYTCSLFKVRVEHINVEVLEGGGAALVQYLQHIGQLVRRVAALRRARCRACRPRASPLPRPHAVRMRVWVVVVVVVVRGGRQVGGRGRRACRAAVRGSARAAAAATARRLATIRVRLAAGTAPARAERGPRSVRRRPLSAHDAAGEEQGEEPDTRPGGASDSRRSLLQRVPCPHFLTNDLPKCLYRRYIQHHHCKD